MNHSENVSNLLAALATFQGEVSSVGKDGRGNYGTYASLAAARSATSEALAKNGLSVVQLPEGDDLTTIVGHSSGEWIAATMNLHLPKQDPQGQGSAITYARRYAYMAALGLAPEDDDGQSASAAVASEGKAPRRSNFTPSPPTAPTQNPEESAGPCSICGSTRAQTVLVKGVPRCALASDCKKRAEEAQAVPTSTEPF